MINTTQDVAEIRPANVGEEKNIMNNEIDYTDLLSPGDKKTVEILWTGGWDSTFRVVELSREDNIVIQPIYIIDPNRKSVEYEKRSMDNIVSALKRKPGTKAEFMPTVMYRLEEIPRDDNISKAFHTIHAITNLGNQHEWLAWLGKLHPNMEMCTEAGIAETSHIIDAIERFCTLDIKDNIGHVNHEKSTEEGNLVLGWFTFPIITRTEVEMFQTIRDWGYEDVMKHIWFCHNPINGEPCGFCHPCDVKMESGMEWLLPLQAQKNYKMHKRVERVLGKYVSHCLIKYQRRIQKK